MTKTVSIADINAMDRAAFTAALGCIYEHSPWVAERAWDARPFDSRAALAHALEQVVGAAGHSKQLELLRLHPRLGTRQKLTAFSEREQADAGLRAHQPEASDPLQALNEAYETKFRFPFIIAVRGLGPETILKRCRERLQADAKSEFQESLRQVFKIASFRLAGLINEN